MSAAQQDRAGACTLRRRIGTEGFYIDLDGKQIGQLFSPVRGVEAANTWVVSVDPLHAIHANILPPGASLYREFATLDAAADFLGVEVPPALVYVPWSYQDGFVSGVAA